MDTEKTKISSKDKNLQKTFSHQGKQKSTKTIKKHKQKEIDEVDSLAFLKDTTEKNKVDVDEKMKFLKSELQSLFNISASNCSNDELSICFRKETPSSVAIEENPDQKESSILPLKSEFIHNRDFGCKPSPIKFPELFDVTDEEVDKTHTGFSNHSNLQSNLLSDKTLLLDESTANECSFKLSFGSPPLSENEVERLLYKSFYLQNYDVYLSSSDENNVDEVQSLDKIKERKCRTKNPIKEFKRERVWQKKLNKRRSHRRKRRRVLPESSFETSVEVVDLMDSSSFYNSAVQDASQECVDLTEYDWNEPFSIDDNSESIVEILDTPKKVTPETAEQEGNDYNFKTIENNSSALNDSCELPSKKGWECPICFEPSRGQAVVATQCGHVFCKKCLDTHILTFSKNCPTCRADLSKKSPISLFNF